MTSVFELLREGGSRALIMGIAGILCTAWGIYQLRHTTQKRTRILHVICSMTPALMGLWVFYTMFSAYQHIAQSTIAPTRQEFEIVMSDAVILGSLSILCTIIPVGVSFAGFMKHEPSGGMTSSLTPQS